jgi:hypothetical protein
VKDFHLRASHVVHSRIVDPHALNSEVSNNGRPPDARADNSEKHQLITYVAFIGR